MTDTKRLVKLYKEKEVLENLVNAVVLIDGYEFKYGEPIDNEIKENALLQIAMADILSEVIAEAFGFSKKAVTESKKEIVAGLFADWEVD